MRRNQILDPAFEGLKPVLLERMTRLGAEIHAAEFGLLLDPLTRGILKEGFAEAGAHEGTLWLVDATGRFLEPAYNSGPRAAEIVGHFKQPLATGLISMVFATEQPFLENQVPQNTHQSKLLDTKLKVQTHALIAVPFHFLKACRGIVSCVQLSPSGPATEPPGFRAEHLTSVQRAAALVARLVEYRLLSSTVGWTCD